MLLDRQILYSIKYRQIPLKSNQKDFTMRPIVSQPHYNKNWSSVPENCLKVSTLGDFNFHRTESAKIRYLKLTKILKKSTV